MQCREENKHSIIYSTNGMMAPSPSKSSKTQHPSFIITADSVDSSPVPSSPPSTDAPKSQCSSLSDGESFECYGENDNSISENGGVDLELAPTLNSTPISESNNNNNNNGTGITRHAWSRMSLRGAPKSQNNDNLPNRRWGSMRHSGKRQLGSNALANGKTASGSIPSMGMSIHSPSNLQAIPVTLIPWQNRSAPAGQLETSMD
ncbi:AAEL006781-PA [Aedes aegypti]|uniref:AAEL006781-PA n=1 Tax=Aedes aegypti TaxID=7159 RepID=Q174W4_AEDAE|nr:AAEL006781-PA [Aedes aegypti]